MAVNLRGLYAGGGGQFGDNSGFTPGPVVLPPSQPYSFDPGPVVYPPYAPVSVPTNPVPLNPFSGLDAGDIGTFAATGCNLITQPALKALCLAGVGLLPGYVADATSGYISGSTGSPTGCPEGSVVDSEGKCVTAGIGGAVQRGLPFGKTGTLADYSGEVRMGLYGPALVPVQVGTVARRDGTQGPILRCLYGMVLGRDSLCYNKGTRGLQRKNPPGTRPFLTGGEVRVLSRARGLEKRAKKLVGKYTHKPCSCATRGRKKK